MTKALDLLGIGSLPPPWRVTHDTVEFTRGFRRDGPLVIYKVTYNSLEPRWEWMLEAHEAAADSPLDVRLKGRMTYHSSEADAKASAGRQSKDLGLSPVAKWERRRTINLERHVTRDFYIWIVWTEELGAGPMFGIRKERVPDPVDLYVTPTATQGVFDATEFIDAVEHALAGVGEDPTDADLEAALNLPKEIATIRVRDI